MISIIVPAFNVLKCIASCLDSILAQIYIEFELIIIDDGSTDGTQNICDQFAERDSRVRVFHKPNGGVSSARNLGLKKANGEWVYFVDADDELFPDALSVLARGIESGANLTVGGYEVFDSKGNSRFIVDERMVEIVSTKDFLFQMYEPKYYYYQGYLWNKLFKREVILNNNLLFDDSIFFNEDRLFVVQYLCSMRGDVFFTTEPVYRYYSRDTGAMASLHRSFNYKYVTDFDAYIKMLACIMQQSYDKKLVHMAKDGVWRSFNDIKSMMARHNVEDEELGEYLEKNMRRALGVYYYELYLRQRYHRIKRMVKIVVKH